MSAPVVPTLGTLCQRSSLHLNGPYVAGRPLGPGYTTLIRIGTGRAIAGIPCGAARDGYAGYVYFDFYTAFNSTSSTSSKKHNPIIDPNNESAVRAGTIDGQVIRDVQRAAVGLERVGTGR